MNSKTFIEYSLDNAATSTTSHNEVYMDELPAITLYLLSWILKREKLTYSGLLQQVNRDELVEANLLTAINLYILRYLSEYMATHEIKALQTGVD